MKRKFAIFNLALMALVQLTIAYQSFHAFSHTHNAFEHHELKKEAKQFSVNNHDHEEDCSVCDFHFDYFIQPQQFCLRLDFHFTEIPYRFNSVENTASVFAGSLFSHRGPPLV
jgi:hypothetical protein